ncbi:MAG: LysR family transcriptional regulator [Rhizobiales bacterium]|nr:LysR family transcriptional regulator [Hyphomicrobiales bacterium]NRB13018.1 LysR family transcriptional regulator [Hyphomicrobiales bacterium]
MDNFSRIEIFLSVADAGSFTAAGKKLNMTGSGISKQIQNLEDRLKSKLFYRTTRKVTLTEAGELYYKRANNAISNIREVESELIDLQATPTGALKVNLPLSFGISHLAADIAKFAATYPDIKLDLSFSDSRVDVVAGGFDVVVRIGAAPDSVFKARKLVSCPIIVCASQDYLDKHGTPDNPQDLADHQMIIYTGKDNQNNWTYQNEDRSIGHVNFSSILKSDNGEMNNQATLQGIGIAIQPLFIVIDQLKSGALQWILQDYHSYPVWDIYALYPADRFLTRKARLFIDMLVEACKKMEIGDECRGKTECRERI